MHKWPQPFCQKTEYHLHQITAKFSIIENDRLKFKVKVKFFEYFLAFCLSLLNKVILSYSNEHVMVGPSIIFYIFFAIPYLILMYWLVKQDKKKYVWGIAVVTVIAIMGIYVSQKASKNAVENYKQHQIDAREQEAELQDSTRE